MLYFYRRNKSVKDLKVGDSQWCWYSLQSKARKTNYKSSLGYLCT